MTTPRELMDQLADLDLAQGTESRPAAASAWRTATVRRQRSRVAAAVVAVVAVAAAVPVLRAVSTPAGPPAWRPSPTTRLTSTPDSGAPLPTTTLADGVVVQQAPLPALTHRWPLLPGPFAALAQLPTAARAATLPTLASDPVRLIRAAVDLPPEAAPEQVLVLVLGDDGRWRRLGVTLTDTRDAGGNRGDALDPASISADGSQLAFPQPDAVVVVTGTGATRRLAVPGRNEVVRWRPDGRHLVTGELGVPATELDTVTGTTTRLVRPAAELVVGSAPAAVVAWGTVVGPDNRYGAGYLTGGRLAMSGYLPQDLSADQGPVVVDQASGGQTVLRLGYNDTADPLLQRGKGCCETLGWLDRHRVLLRDGQSVLAWDVDQARGHLVAVLPVPAWTIALGPPA